MSQEYSLPPRLFSSCIAPVLPPGPPPMFIVRMIPPPPILPHQCHSPNSKERTSLKFDPSTIADFPGSVARRNPLAPTFQSLASVLQSEDDVQNKALKDKSENCRQRDMTTPGLDSDLVQPLRMLLSLFTTASRLKELVDKLVASGSGSFPVGAESQVELERTSQLMVRLREEVARQTVRLGCSTSRRTSINKYSSDGHIIDGVIPAKTNSDKHSSAQQAESHSDSGGMWEQRGTMNSKQVDSQSNTSDEKINPGDGASGDSGHSFRSHCCQNSNDGLTEGEGDAAQNMYLSPGCYVIDSRSGLPTKDPAQQLLVKEESTDCKDNNNNNCCHLDADFHQQKCTFGTHDESNRNFEDDITAKGKNKSENTSPKIGDEHWELACGSVSQLQEKVLLERRQSTDTWLRHSLSRHCWNVPLQANQANETKTSILPAAGDRASVAKPRPEAEGTNIAKTSVLSMARTQASSARLRSQPKETRTAKTNTHPVVGAQASLAMPQESEGFFELPDENGENLSTLKRVVGSTAPKTQCERLHNISRSIHNNSKMITIDETMAQDNTTLNKHVDDIQILFRGLLKGSRPNPKNETAAIPTTGTFSQGM